MTNDDRADSTDQDGADAATGPGSTDRGWREDTQAAIDQASQALRTAWDATRETRGTALEAAKEATGALAAAIEEGIAAARASWSGDVSAEPDDPPPPPPPAGRVAQAPDPAPGPDDPGN